MFNITIGLRHCEVKQNSKRVCIILGLSRYKLICHLSAVPIVLNGHCLVRRYPSFY